MEKRREDKTNTVQIKRTNVRRNVEKIRQILYKLNELTYGET